MKKLQTPLMALLVIAGLVAAPGGASARVDSHDDFVTVAYRDLLGRAPDPAGYDYWVGLLEDGVPAGAVAGAIGDSDEQRRLVVSQAYERVLKREPDSGGLQYWSADLIDRTSEAELYWLLFGSDEYLNSSGQTNVSYVSALYRDILTRSPDNPGLEYWTALLDTGLGREVVARDFMLGAEAILQPDLSIVSSTPSAESSVNALRRITVDLDAEIDASSSAMIVSADGRRIRGVTSAGESASQLVFRPTSFPPELRTGSPASVVVTIFAYTGTGFGRTDYTYTLNPSATLALNELIVAFYGHAKTDVLGVMGEGTPHQALLRLNEQAAPYRLQTKPVVPAFELIATLVTAAPGADRLYRSRTEHSLIQPYLDEIRAANGYLILDIQPGRADLEDEARSYEPLLLNPEVGLALDPEWKVGPNQTPKGRIGAIDAAEINRVSAYLSELVIANNLPNKILIIHIFEADMVRNPDQIATRPGVTIIFQADGEGGPTGKGGDYRTLLPDRFGRGFKVFYDEDRPTLNPAQVLDLLDPDPDYVSYQ